VLPLLGLQAGDDVSLLLVHFVAIVVVDYVRIEGDFEPGALFPHSRRALVVLAVGHFQRGLLLLQDRSVALLKSVVQILAEVMGIVLIRRKMLLLLLLLLLFPLGLQRIRLEGENGSI